MKTAEDKQIKLDIMRYTKNKLASNLVLLAIVADVFFFVSIYKKDVGTYYYTVLTGVSVVYNLIFMLFAFLASEGIKNYKKHFSYVLAGLGLFQIARIFIIPLKARNAVVTMGTEEIRVMGNAQFTRCIFYLLISAAALIGAAVVGYFRSVKLSAYLDSLGPEARRD